MSAALCGVAIFFVFSVPTQASDRSASHRKAHSDKDPSSPFVGAASTYNPFRPGYDSGGKQTASGEDYSEHSWTAAIQTRLRKFFGGISENTYRPRFALVETADKRAVVKINDVGPLKPGRIIDFNERTMKYFDPTMQRGVIKNVRVTPLQGEDWIPGPA